MSGCPHKSIVHCPLYVAAHDADLCRFGCADDLTIDGMCAVGRGAMDHRQAVERLRVAAPRLVAEIEFAEEAATAREQRARNMRLAGIH